MTHNRTEAGMPVTTASYAAARSS